MLFANRKVAQDFFLKKGHHTYNRFIKFSFHELPSCGNVHVKRNIYYTLHKTQNNVTYEKNSHSPLFEDMISLKAMEKNIQNSPVKIHLDTPEFHSIFTGGLKRLQELFSKYNYEIRLCGGAVRDLLLGNKPKDLDFATIATPDQMISMFQKEEVRLINETGWGHGTVTCRLEEENFEITTLRVDTVTDGRRAIVEFTKDWELDASRRDLTFNSMFLTLNGDVIDFFNGIEDLENRYVRFVGDPETRILEDYLRILRYFRFFGRVANPHTEFDQSTLDVIAKNASGLTKVAGERIQVELELIIAGDHVVQIVKAMQKCGILEYIGLPNSDDLNEFEKTYNHCRNLSPHFMTLVSALLRNEDDLEAYHKRAKFSNVYLHVGRFIVKHRSQTVQPCDLLTWYVDVLVEYSKMYYKQKAGIHCFLEFLKYKGDVQALQYFRNFQIPKLPVNGTNIKNKTNAKGKDVGLLLNMLFQLWKESRYNMTKDELLDHINESTLQKLKD